MESKKQAEGRVDLTRTRSQGTCSTCTLVYYLDIGEEVVCYNCGTEATPDHISLIDIDLFGKEW